MEQRVARLEAWGRSVIGSVSSGGFELQTLFSANLTCSTHVGVLRSHMDHMTWEAQEYILSVHLLSLFTKRDLLRAQFLRNAPLLITQISPSPH